MALVDQSYAERAFGLNLLAELALTELAEEDPELYSAASRTRGEVQGLRRKHSPKRNADSMHYEARAMSSAPKKTRKQGSRAKLSKESSSVLEAWLHQHVEHPYPTAVEKQELSQAANLTVKQVSDFMGNWRKRKWNVPASLQVNMDLSD